MDGKYKLEAQISPLTKPAFGSAAGLALAVKKPPDYIYMYKAAKKAARRGVGTDNA